MVSMKGEARKPGWNSRVTQAPARVTAAFDHDDAETRAAEKVAAAKPSAPAPMIAAS